jgi:phage gp29-like protein
MAKRPGFARPGFGIPPLPSANINTRTEKRLEENREDVMTGRVAVDAGPYSDRISMYPASNLDPSKIDRIFRSADLGVAIYQYAELCKQMRERDSHLLGIDRKRRFGVANKPFLFWPASENDPVSVALAHACRSILRGIDGFKSSMYSALSKNCDGWSMNEIVWAWGKIRFQIPDGNGGGPLVTVEGMWPRQVFWVHSKHTEFTLDSSDEPLLNLGSDGAVRLPRGKFLYTMTPGDGIACARGYSRAVVWMHFFKHASIRDWNVFLHLYGIPFLQGKMDRSMWKDRSMKTVLELALQAYGTGESAPILPDGLSVEAHDPVSMGGSGEAHKSLAGFCNAEISKAVSGETLTIEAGESGSYKLGDVHQDSEHEVIVGDACTLAEDTRRDVFETAIEINAVRLARALEEAGIRVLPEDLPLSMPDCGFRTDREWSPSQRLEIYKGATTIGIKGSKAQFRNEFQYDAPTSPDDELKGEAVTITAGGKAVGATDASEGAEAPPKPQTSNA